MTEPSTTMLPEPLAEALERVLGEQIAGGGHADQIGQRLKQLEARPPGSAPLHSTEVL